MSKKAQVEEVTLAFDLHELPTAQHRAGLSGLIFQIDAMGRDGYQRPDKLVPVIKKLTATTAEIAFTRDSMQGVFDELYVAKPVEVVVETRWPDETKPKPGEYFVSKKDPKTGVVKQATGFPYDVVQPQAPALKRHLVGNRGSWLELWREMLWAIPRGGNNVRSRAPFIDLANGRPSGEGESAWTQAVDFQDRRAKSQFKTEPISGALILGAQAINAEGVSFSGRVDQNLLLHFWQLVVLTFVPQVVARKDGKVERVGYVLAIPDVADLIGFRVGFPEILQNLEAKDPRHTPPNARLDLPAQAGLETLRRLRNAARDEAIAKYVRSVQRGGLGKRRGDYRAPAASKAAREWGRCVRGVETYHMFKLGTNVKLVSFSRVDDRPGLTEEYDRIDKSFRNPLFRAGLMRSLLRDRPWHWGMIEPFAEYPHRFFLETEETPTYLPHFGRDARALFTAHQQEIRGMTPDEMIDEEKFKHLGQIVRNLITSYVNRTTACPAIGRDSTTRTSSPSSSPTIPTRRSTPTTSSSATWWRPAAPTGPRSRRS